MLDLAGAPTPIPFDPHTVDERSDTELDAQPFGVIGLDDDGTILRYNLYESRFARLDRNQVVGRNFFSEVARCTRNDAFEGRFRRFVASKDEGNIETFDFLFDFNFGAQEVSIDLVKAGGVDRYYLFINRRKVGAPRPDFPVSQLAALQSSLAPDERAHGVRRDALERRFVEAPAPFFAALRATCDSLAPEAWQVFSHEWGVHWGRRAAVDLEAVALESTDKSLRDLPMREVANLVTGYLSERGWGTLRFDFSHTPDGLICLDLERSVLAESAPSPRGISKEKPYMACSLIAGFVSGTLSTIAHRRLAGREIACVASGAAVCKLVIVGNERRTVLETSVREGACTIEQVLTSLRRTSPSLGSTR